jgi:hypothetical protein
MAALVILATSVGAGGVLAAQEIRRSRAAELLSVQYQIRFEIARLREQAVFADVQEMLQAREQGLVAAQEFYAVEEQRIALAQEASVLGLDAIEVGYTGREPDRRISAATVEGRDLVTERFDQELSSFDFRVSAAGRRAEELARLHEQGLTPDSELGRARELARDLTAQRDSIRRKKALRARFLRGELDGARVDLLGLLEDLQPRLERAEAELELAERDLAHAQTLFDAGVTGEREVRTRRHEVATAEAQLRLAQLELDTVEARLGELPERTPPDRR